MSNEALGMRCPKVYEVKGWRERCVKVAHAEDEPCQLTLWWSLKIEPLDLNIGTGIDCGVITVRRVE